MDNLNRMLHINESQKKYIIKYFIIYFLIRIYTIDELKVIPQYSTGATL